MNRVSKVLADFVLSKAPGMDEEQGHGEPAGSTPRPQAPPDARRPTIIARPDSPISDEALANLSTFRYLIGITTDRSMVTAQATATARPGARPASNVGLYKRVVHNEQNSKKGYKYFSLLINSCLGLQIVVAAALTAMGAANSNHNAVTAFGAINTIIAGFLTYLKGSGLPGRLKYFANEWKRLREYIEQRERDLSRPSGSFLDVYAIVAVIEQMYDETKTDVEVNTPDGYISVSNVRNKRSAQEAGGSSGFNHVETSKSPTQGVGSIRPELFRTSSATSKLKGFESSLAEKLQEAGQLRNSVAEKVHEVEHARTAIDEKLHAADRVRQDVEREVDRGEQNLSERVRELRGSIDNRVRDLTSNIDQSTRNVARDIESQSQQSSARARELEASAIEDISRDIQEHAKRKIDELRARLSH